MYKKVCHQDIQSKMTVIEKEELLEDNNTNSPSIENVKTDWSSIYVVSIITFLTAQQFSSYISSIWPYLQILESDVNEKFYGTVAASYAVGGIIFGPLFGYYSNKIHQVKVPLLIGLSGMFLGHLLYVFIEVIPFYQRYFLILSRLLAGLANSNLSLCKSYATSASTVEDRSRVVAWISGSLALGITVGPAMNGIFTLIKYPGYQFIGFLSVNMYTLPGYFGILTTLVMMVVSYFLLKENHISVTNKVSKKHEDYIKIPNFDKVAVAIVNTTRFTQMFVLTTIDGISSFFAMMMFDLPKIETVRVISSTQVSLGVLSVIIHFFFIFFDLGRFIQFRKTVICSLMLLIAFHVVTYSYPVLPRNVTLYNSSHITFNVSGDKIGCDVDKFEWCSDLKATNFWLYFTAYAFAIGVAFPLGNICMNTIFSKILGPRNQSFHNAIVQSSGAVAQCAGPILMSRVYYAFGPRVFWFIQTALVSFTLSLWCIFHKRMVGLIQHNKLVKEDETTATPSDLLNKPE
uniref:MFS domain-containing protein n=1 Tax=Rhabditophanes sp. KR3021 TaxID=114890 RepID=A0AC35TWA0_9BILA